MSRFVYLNEAFDGWCRRVHVSVLPFRIAWDQGFAVVYDVSDLGWEVSGGVFGCALELVSFYRVLDLGIILFDW